MNETQKGKTPNAQPSISSGESGLESISIPWETRRLKGVCMFEYGDSLAEEYRTNEGVSVYGSNGLIGHTLTPNTENECVIIGRKGSSGKVLYSEKSAFAIDTTFFVDRRHTRANIRWLYYLLTSLNLESLSGDVGVPGLSRARAYQQACPYPPLNEQAAIVRYLDAADQKIQSYISAKEKLIALLEEQRQAIIYQAVTRGLDPNVKLKPSSMEWLGDVPEHWEVTQLGRLGSFSKGSGGTKEDEAPTGLPCIRYGDLYTTHKYFIDKSRSFIPVEKASNYTPIKKGDVLFPTSGETIEEIGKSAVNLIEPPVYCGGDLIIFRPKAMVNAKYSGYSLDSAKAQDQKSKMGRGVSIMHIYSNQLKYLWTPIPPVEEQEAIAGYIDESTEAIDKSISQTRRQIELIEEYRTRLIAYVVTGKLDVRMVT